jgi:hypothetical protein
MTLDPRYAKQIPWINPVFINLIVYFNQASNALINISDQENECYYAIDNIKAFFFY